MILSKSDLEQMTDGQRQIYFAGVKAGNAFKTEQVLSVLRSNLSKNNTLKLTNDGLLFAIELVESLK